MGTAGSSSDLGGEAAWHRQLLKDAEEAAGVRRPPTHLSSGGATSVDNSAPSTPRASAHPDDDHATPELARDLAHACAALGRELAKLNGNLRWADSVISAAESAEKMTGAAGMESGSFHRGDAG